MSLELEKNERARKYAAEGKYAEAAALCQQLLAESSNSRGPDHKTTLQFRDHAAQCLGGAGDYAAAITVDEETLKLRRKKSSTSDPDVCATLYRLATNYRERKQFELAVNANQEAKGIREALPNGWGLPDLLDIQYDLAYDLNKLQKYDQASTLNRRTLHSLLKTSSKDDEKVMSCRESLAIDLYSLGGLMNLQAAIKLFKENLSIAQELDETEDAILWRKEWCDICQMRLDESLKTKEQTPQHQQSIPPLQDSVAQKDGSEVSKQMRNPTAQAGIDVLAPSIGKQYDSDLAKQTIQATKTAEVAPTGGRKDDRSIPTRMNPPLRDLRKDSEKAERTNNRCETTKQGKQNGTTELKSSSKERRNSLIDLPVISSPDGDEVKKRIEKAYRYVKFVPNLRSKDGHNQEVQATYIGSPARHRDDSGSQKHQSTSTSQSQSYRPKIDIVVHHNESRLKPDNGVDTKRSHSEQGNNRRRMENENSQSASHVKRRSFDANAIKKDFPDTTSQDKSAESRNLQAPVLNKLEAKPNVDLRNISSDSRKNMVQMDSDISFGDWKSMSRSQPTNKQSTPTTLPKSSHKIIANQDVRSKENQKIVQPTTTADKNFTTILPVPKTEAGNSGSTEGKVDAAIPEVSALKIASATPTRSASLPTRPAQGKYSKKTVSLFDNSKPDGEMTIGSAEADAWFRQLREESHEVFDREKTHSGVKIAILDTGIDGAHPYFRAARRRIQGYKSWVAPVAKCGACRDNGGISAGVLKDKCKDDNGHGTHAAALLLKVDPWAQLYVARIAEGDGQDGVKIDVEHVTEAIAHAIDVWKVDIITISFGWPTRPKSYDRIEDVIDRAIRHKILVFAAASNTGANSAAGPAFPASLERVFCINSANGVGRRSDFNPTDPGGWNIFTAPGEAVESARPLHHNKGSSKRDSGTSIATPIAAGIAALVLEFAKQQLPNTEWETAVNFLKDFSGMCYAFMLMANDKDDKGFRYIRPSALFDASRRDHGRTFATSTIINKLRDHYPFED